MIYMLFLVYFMIPILSVEGVVGWYIAGIGVYNTIKLYRSNIKEKNKKALRILIICCIIALVYNLIVNYVTKIVVSNFL
ncbi:hypothetical protein VT91_17830 [Clostridium sporogenes]|uniref:hypothetical protein n=1 Tax=Clostridium botulinum TaxID=1491 RepID=UPI000717798B|nr:hypothetical protein [Clostridium botulinum]KRU25541.1 hypothetical protein VT28_31530 [Clostridium sporogenes]KRU27293.1 hypothetical protein WG71_21400 [Clostridium sporogenes]KRU30215.1 hypothetical protein VT91_17830 [Clostridium sporogenes]KRU38399.1 hypothetical protein VT95_31710 [Clostridium sporogenes]MBZ1328941.1 hypothetical protein [Clostridium botulinum]